MSGRVVPRPRLLRSAARRRPAAHEIPNEVTVQTFLKPEGQRLTFLVRAPLKAMRDIEVPRARADGYIDFDARRPGTPRRGDALDRRLVKLYEDRPAAAVPRGGRGARLAARAIDRSTPTIRRSHTITGPPLPPDTELIWKEGLLDVVFVYPDPVRSVAVRDQSGLTRLGLRVNVVMRFLPPGGTERAFDVHGDPGVVAARSALASGGAALRQGRVLPHPRRHRSSALPALPGDSVPPLPVADPRGHVVHDRALDHADRVGVRPGARRVVVSAARRDAHRGLDRLHGVREHRRGAPQGCEPALSGAGRSRSASGWSTGSAFRSRCASRCSLPGSHLLTSLLAFNVGVELGQVLVLVVLVPALTLLFRYVVAERMGTIVLSALVVHTGWHWAIERGDYCCNIRGRSSTRRCC